MKIIKLVSFFFVLTSIGGQMSLATVEKESNSIISFEEDTSLTPPVNPENPEKPAKPIDPTKPEEPNQGTSGPLSIDYASSFDFGTQKISVKNETYKAKLQTFEDGETGPNYVQITDKRGTATGWQLSVTQLDQFKAGKNELKGAELSLEELGLNGIIGEDYAPHVTLNQQALIPKAKTLVAQAKQNEGMGTWLLYFGKKIEGNKLDGMDAISLFVPASAIKLKDVDYQTTLEWELTDAPIR